MKKYFVLLAMVFAVTAVFAQQGKDSKPAKKAFHPVALKSSADSASYAYGVTLAASVKRQMGTDVNKDVLVAALLAALNEDSLQISPEVSAKCMNDYNRLKMQKDSEAARKEGVAYLETNKKRKGVTTTASGLQYEVISKGAGTVNPKATDKVEVHYHGTLIDGSVFDSSVERGKTATFGLNQVIKGWTEGLQYMQEGDKFRFVIPADLAYGDRSPSPKIKPGSTLIFEVELIKILGN